VDHQVKMADFERWLEKPGGTPREVVERQRIDPSDTWYGGIPIDASQP
jgi:hypothetical protein